jgi:hypothetical protein
MNEPDTSAFPMSRLVPFLRAMADPTGSGEMSPTDRAMVEQVEANLARQDLRAED